MPYAGPREAIPSPLYCCETGVEIANLQIRTGEMGNRQSQRTRPQVSEVDGNGSVPVILRRGESYTSALISSETMEVIKAYSNEEYQGTAENA
jgi:hypothetical protein